MSSLRLDPLLVLVSTQMCWSQLQHWYNIWLAFPWKREMRESERVVLAVLLFGDGRQWVRQDCTVWRLEDRRMEVTEGLLVLWADGECERFLPWNELSLTNCCLHSQNLLFVCWTIMRTCEHIYKGSNVIHCVWSPQDLV